MPKSFLALRNGRYHYVRRVPSDLVSLFPSPVISRSLHTTDRKYATIIASAWEYKTHQLFLQLRSGMLDAQLMDYLIARYLNSGLQALESMAYGRKPRREEFSTPVAIREQFSPYVADRSGLVAEEIQQMRQAVINKNIEAAYPYLESYLKPVLKSEYKVSRLSTHEHLELSVRLLQTLRTLALAEEEILNGNLDPLTELSSKVKAGLEKPYLALDKVIERYSEKYKTDNHPMEKRAEQHLDTELDVIQEIFGNVSLDFVNSREGIVNCKKILKKYPLNRVQRFGKRPNQEAKPSERVRSLQDIIKNEESCEVIKPQTANAYIKRLKAIIDYANDYEEFDQRNRWENELFPVRAEDEKKRNPYDQEDIDRLITAICSQNLWVYGDPKPERFWIILIALLQGFRLGNITRLGKKDVFRRNGVWVFRLVKGKTKNTVDMVYPINDCLILLGFIEWVDSLQRDNLFQDTSKQASVWYNRMDRNEDGSVKAAGFEYSHVTKDESKCLYSLRHNYGGEVYSVTTDIKATAAAMGHAPIAGAITNRYIGELKLKTRQELASKLKFDIDLDALEKRVEELFGIKPS
ncbi:DUF6538 domain-containing protein [Trichlorobacter lovleyi]|uniref:Integrase family protein n=1 Tax=Trichlorobacter lovleyi (strain ATCC BAA-1151 / DSM 17278 / SZ) TaxID=398767 RepID=B3E8B3_TRIL1|nr:DUF6538 domain-containing protein [Trichlorobacter lovleyi]ACD95150.1 integrase family protein [Trichlorobacter lovleyi SZ]